MHRVHPHLQTHTHTHTISCRRWEQKNGTNNESEKKRHRIKPNISILKSVSKEKRKKLCSLLAVYCLQHFSPNSERMLVEFNVVGVFCSNKTYNLNIYLEKRRNQTEPKSENIEKV